MFLLERAEISERTAGQPVSQPATQRKAGAWTGGILSVGIVSIWLILIHNRFLTPHEGWFSYYGFLIRSGEVPYRDFYFFTQPLSLFISWCIEGFGDKLIYFRYYGIAERIVMTAALYYLLSRYFSPAGSACATIASSLLFVAYMTDALFSYLYTCLLFFLFSVICLQRAWTSPRRRSLWMFAAGICGGLSFFAKQSNGLLALAAACFAILIVSDRLKGAVRDLAVFLAGVLSAASPFLGWLLVNRAWTPYVDEVFRGAASSKGGLGTVLFGFFRQMDLVPAICVLTAYAIVLLLVLAGKLKWREESEHTRGIQDRAVFAALSLAFALCAFKVHRLGAVPIYLVRYAAAIVVDLTMCALPFLLFFVVWRRWKAGAEWLRGHEVPASLLTASFFWTWSCGMSWAVQEQSAVPTLALFVACAFDRVRLGKGRSMPVLVTLATILIMTLAIFQKWTVAFNWEGWMEPMSQEATHSRWEQIADYALDRSDSHMYDTLFDDMKRYSKPGDQVVTFPTIPVFAFVGSHTQPTFSQVQYWDVCPDNIARADASRILADPPRFIVDLELAKWVWDGHDRGWRAGRRSGQRDFRDAMAILTSSGGYTLVSSYRNPFYRMPLKLWVRNR